MQCTLPRLISAAVLDVKTAVIHIWRWQVNIIYQQTLSDFTDDDLAFVMFFSFKPNNPAAQRREEPLNRDMAQHRRANSLGQDSGQ